MTNFITHRSVNSVRIDPWSLEPPIKNNRTDISGAKKAKLVTDWILGGHALKFELSFLKPREIIARLMCNKSLYHYFKTQLPNIRLTWLNSGKGLDALGMEGETLAAFLQNRGDGVTLLNPGKCPLSMIEECKNLKHLVIDYGSQDFRFISEAKGLQSLKIDVSTCPAEQIEELGGKLVQLSHLQKMSFSGEAVDRMQEVLPILDGLSEHSELREVEFVGFYISEDAAATMGALLERQTNLQKFELSCCKFTELDAATELFQGLKNHEHLKEVAITYNSYGQGLGEFTGAECIAEGLEELPSLQKLDISLNGIGTEGLKAVATKLGELPRLNQIDLSGNDQCPSGIKAILKELLDKRENFKEKEITIDMGSCSNESKNRVYRVKTIEDQTNPDFVQIKLICSSDFQRSLTKYGEFIKDFQGLLDQSSF